MAGMSPRSPSRLLLATAALAALGGCRAVPVQVFPHAPELRFSGRVERDAQGPILAWPGTSLTVRFTGTSLGLRLLDLPKPEPERTAPNRFRVSVDGEPFRDLYVGQGPILYRVAEGLPEGEHVLRLEKETEAVVGETQLLGLELSPGARLLPPSPAPSRRLEFIGDSGITGFGIEGQNEHCSFSVETQRVSLAYPALTAQALEAEAHFIAFSGKGLVINYGDSPQPTLPQLYERTLPHREHGRWDFQAWTPDAVVIHLGANDFWKEHPGEERYRDAYRAFLEGLRQRYPQAHLLCVLAPGLVDHHPKDVRARTHFRALVSGLVEQLRREGDERVHFVEVPLSAPEEGLGCLWHPSRQTHQRMSALMTGRLRELLGWR
jgi:lysophospholipase L1-like esterase